VTERAIMADGTWTRIDQVLMQLRNLTAGLVSDDYATRIRRNLEAEAPEELIRATLYRLAAEL
jgi:hypothetical protein